MKIKVAFFADCLIRDYDGAIRTMYHIIDRIDPNKFEYLFITGDGPNIQSEHQCFAVPSVPLPINNNYKVSLSFLTNDKLNKKLADFNPDIIHIATPSPLGHFGLKYALRYGLPTISIYHTHFISYTDYYFEKVPQLINISRKILTSMMQSFYNKVDLVYVPTVKIKEALCQLGIFTNHLKIWKRGIDTSLFTAKKRDVNYIRNLTKNNYKNLLFASRLVWEKNLKTLVKIYKRIQDENLPYNLLIAGDGYARLQLEKEMPNAIFLGHMDHNTLATIYASSDVFVFPSISETYGNVVAEAMASGLPCVIANGGGTTEFIRQGINGFLCEPYTEEEYLFYIDKILSNEALKTNFILNGIQQTATMCWSALADSYFDDISYLVSNRNLQIA